MQTPKQRHLGLLCAALFVLLPVRTVAAAPRTQIRVSTAAQLISAIGSNRVIRVRRGRYQLDSVPRVDTAHVYWTRVHDGWQLNIKNVRNLTIVGVGAKAHLLIGARYAWVMRFENSHNIVLNNLLMGHIPSGGCMGGVVAFDRSKNIKITNSDLYGSGTYGVGLTKVDKFLMVRSTIRNCTYGIMTIKDSRNVRFLRSTFRHNKQFDLIEIHNTRNVRFDRCTVENNRTGLRRGYALFKVDTRSSVVIRGGRFKNNTIDTFINLPKRLRVFGAPRLMRQINTRLTRPDPRFNQIYKIARYRRWIVTGSQAGITFWDPRRRRVDLLKKAFISNTFLVHGKYLWAGTYSNVFRFDGTNLKSYLHSGSARGHKVFRGPRGGVWVRRGTRYWRYHAGSDRLVRVRATPAWAPRFSSYDLIIRPNRSIWSINFMSFIQRQRSGAITTYRQHSASYPGRDPRRLYQTQTGALWVADFTSGFFVYDPAMDSFTKDPTLSSKAVAMAIDARRKRTWLGHYTRGVYLKRPGKPTRFFDFKRLGYMRDLHLDTNGDLWIGGWNQLVRLRYRNGAWQRQPFVVR